MLLLKVNGKCKDRREINYFGQSFPRSDNLRFDLAILKTSFLERKMNKEGYWLDLGDIQLCCFYVRYLLPFLAAAAFIRTRVRLTCSATTRD